MRAERRFAEFVAPVGRQFTSRSEPGSALALARRDSINTEARVVAPRVPRIDHEQPPS